MNTEINRCYSDLILLPTFKERFDYLKLSGSVGVDTFGFDRYLNQKFYSSPEWKRVRDTVIVRDNGCDLGIDGYLIHGKIYIHHMNPVNADDILQRRGWMLEPEYLICVSHETHNAIHYGDYSLLSKEPMERKPNDTCPWKV